MKARLTIIGGVALLLASALQSFGIEGLKLSLQCSNVVVCWPSVDGDAYFIRYRPDLTTNSSWTILTNAYPAASGTNMTYFVHSNVVLNPNCGGNGGGGSGGTNSAPPPPKPSSTQSSTSSSTSTSTQNSPPPPREAPLPWDPKWQAHGNANTASGTSSPTGFAGPNGSGPQCGFYEVVKMGIHLWGVTNGMVLSGAVPLKFEFANGDTNGVLSGIFLGDTNGPLSGVTIPLVGTNTTKLCGTWDTMQKTNGTYVIQAGAQLSDEVFYMDHPVTVTVSNLLWFPDGDQVFGDAIYVGAQTPYTDGAGRWQVDAYDANNVYYGSLTGPIDPSGFLSLAGAPGQGFSVNNLDQFGNRVITGGANIVITTDAKHPIRPPPYPAFTNQMINENGWNFAPTWVIVCYANPFDANNYPLAAQQVHDMMGAIWDDYWPVTGGFHQNQLGTQNNAFQITGPQDWTSVSNYLADYYTRNFVYFGHGNATVLGDSVNKYLPIVTVDAALKNSLVITNTPFPQGNTMPYRFVFLDGCNTAEGAWAPVFGITMEPRTVYYYVQKLGIRPRAFVGWDHTVTFTTWMDQNVMSAAHLSFINQFWQDCIAVDSNGFKNTLIQSVNDAYKLYRAAGKPVVFGAEDIYVMGE